MFIYLFTYRQSAAPELKHHNNSQDFVCFVLNRMPVQCAWRTVGIQ